MKRITNHPPDGKVTADDALRSLGSTATNDFTRIADERVDRLIASPDNPDA